ncbi:MAG: DedA family protein [Candidatus Binatia bacterium]
MEDLASRFGLPAVFVGACLEGDVVLLVGGVLAHLGLLDVRGVLALGLAGLVVSDLVWFGIGRWHADWLQSTRTYRRAAPIVERLAGRAGSLQIVVARVVYGTRVASMVFWGAHGLGLPRFVVLDVIGCTLWSTGFVALGYFLSDSAARLIGDVQRIEHWLAGALVLSIAVVGAIRLIERRRHAARTGMR